MNNKNDFEHATLESISEQRDYRKELWIGIAIAIAVAGSSLPKTERTPASWADTVLSAFDKRFGIENENDNRPLKQ